MARRPGLEWILAFACASAAAHAQAQSPRPFRPLPPVGGSAFRHPAIPPSTAAALQDLAAQAGIIFAGHVVAIARNDSAGYVDITFHIESAVRGCGSKSTYVLREWAGLWSGPDRYLPGQRLLMLLSARGPSGMSAPVGGMAGIIPLLVTREPPLLHGGATPPRDSPAETAQPEAVDLRWVQASALRGIAAASSAGQTPGAQLAPWPGAVEPLAPLMPVSTKHSSRSANVPSLSAVLALLSGGNEAEHGN